MDRKPRARSRDRASTSYDKRQPPLGRSKTTAGTGGKGSGKSRDSPAAGAGGGGGFPKIGPRWQTAATAALQSGAAAAMNMRSQKGAWAGEKGAKVATAAISAAAMDALAGKRQKEHDEKDRSGGGGGRKSHVDNLGGTLGSLLMDQIAKRVSKKR